MGGNCEQDNYGSICTQNIENFIQISDQYGKNFKPFEPKDKLEKEMSRGPEDSYTILLSDEPGNYLVISKKDGKIKKEIYTFDQLKPKPKKEEQNKINKASQKQSKYKNPEGTKLYENIPTTVPKMEKEEQEYLNKIIKENFQDENLNNQKLIWILRWIGIDCPFDNNDVCKGRFDFLIKLRKWNQDIFDHLFDKIETYNLDDHLFLSDEVPGEFKYVYYLDSKQYIQSISYQDLSIEGLPKAIIIVLPTNAFRTKPLKFEITQELGRGYFGEVYQVKSLQTLPRYFPKSKDNLYALKISKKSTDDKERQVILKTFVFENQLMNLIVNDDKKCPSHVSCYFDISQDKDGTYYMLSEMMDGDIKKYIDNSNFDLDSRLSFGLKVYNQTLEGLEDLWQKGIVHRDLKPENLLYKIPNPSNPQEIVIKIADFGLSCVPDDQNIGCENVAGTPEYIDPSIFLYSIRNSKSIPWSKNSDLYALAVILYQIIVNEYYVSDDELEKILKILKAGYFNESLNNHKINSITTIYNEIYNENVKKIDELIVKYKNNFGFIQLLKFIKQNLKPFEGKII